jgi:hypothetical protein
MSFLIELIRAGFEPFRARRIPKSIVRTKEGSPHSIGDGTSTARLKTGAGQR